MKIKIEYTYEANLDNPYFAGTVIKDKQYYGCSKESFEKAKEKLLGRITQDHPVIPEPEEIEV